MRSRSRPGFTLVELMIVLVVFGLVGAATLRVLVRQQRFYRGATEIISMRSNMRELGTVLPGDLRGISSVGGDIYAMSDSAMDFRLQNGIAIVCQIGATRTSIVLPPTTLASKSGVSAWTNAPVLGDTLFVYDDGATSATTDDSWQRLTITAAPSAGTCPTTTGFTSTSTEAAAGTTLAITPALSATVVQGSLVRFYKRAKYKLYQPTAGGSWYLGYLECPGGVCGAMQAVAGPFQPYTAAASTTGLRFVYRDSSGVVTATKTDVARIDITIRAQTLNKIDMPGRANDYYRDSVVVSVALRNRS